MPTPLDVMSREINHYYQSLPGNPGGLGTLVRPKENEERYYCRKGNHARNVQVIADADLNILHVDPSYGGATHDSFIFNYGTIKTHLEDVINSGEVVYLLGDSGYAQRPCLMIPILDAENNTPEAYYNDLHATARNSVERTFAVLKGRFRCLLVPRVMHYHPDIVAKIIIACCVLHNICNRGRLPAPELYQEEVDNERRYVESIQRRQTIDQSFQADLDSDRLVRAQLVNELWRSRDRM
ncbi:putative nuclease HARBI1 [Aphomia sociella]